MTKTYTAPRAEVRNSRLRTSILAGSGRTNEGVGVTVDAMPWDEAREINRRLTDI